MRGFVKHVQSRPRMALAAAVGIVAALAVPGVDRAITRALIGWNVGVWVLLASMALLMFRSDHERLRRAAMDQAESAAAVLTLAVLAAAVSIAAVVMELAAAKGSEHHRWPHLLLALSTVSGSWLLLPMLFAMNYASLYHQEDGVSGLKFPETDEHFRPDFADLLYFSFTIAVASQTSDIAVTSREMRRLVTVQSVLSFVFNTTILAFTINTAASLF